MSNAEYGNPGASYAFTFPAMVAGSTPGGGSSVANFYLNVSVVDRIERVTAGGTPGTPYVNTIGPAVAGTNPPACTIDLNSSNALDTSVYRIYWHNQSDPNTWN